MGYKKFEDMKHKIPEGATHYHNESYDYFFCWFKVDGNKWFVFCPDSVPEWTECKNEHHRSNIVQFIQTESPQEREALDVIDTTSKQVEILANDSELPNGSEWKNGDRVTIRNPEGFGTWDEAEKYLGTNGTVMAVFTNTNGKKVAAVSHDDSVCICWMLSMLSKPESQEQKAERDRDEAIKTIQRDMAFSGSDYQAAKRLYEKGYRKESK